MKGQGISMSMLVVMALAVLVLVIVALFFSGGFRRMGIGLIETTEAMSDQDVALAQVNCNQRCNQILMENDTAVCSCTRCGDGCCDDGEGEPSDVCVFPYSDLGEDFFTCAPDCA